jgi:hypothetical protein
MPWTAVIYGRDPSDDKICVVVDLIRAETWKEADEQAAERARLTYTNTGFTEVGFQTEPCLPGGVIEAEIHHLFAETQKVQEDIEMTDFAVDDQVSWTHVDGSGKTITMKLREGRILSIADGCAVVQKKKGVERVSLGILRKPGQQSQITEFVEAIFQANRRRDR